MRESQDYMAEDRVNDEDFEIRAADGKVIAEQQIDIQTDDNPIKGTLEEPLASTENGVWLVPPPTGSGKSFLVELAMGLFAVGKLPSYMSNVTAESLKSMKRMIFLSPLVEHCKDAEKNVSAVIRANGKDPKNYVIYVKSVFDSAVDFYDWYDNKASEREKDSIQELPFLPELLEKVKEQKIMQEILRNSGQKLSEEHLITSRSEIESICRKARAHMKKNIKKELNIALEGVQGKKAGKEGRDLLVAEWLQDHYRWIRILWPATMYPLAKVIIMTSTLSLRPMNSLFTRSRWIEWMIGDGKGSAVILDESDSIKEVWKSEILKDAASPARCYDMIDAASTLSTLFTGRNMTDFSPLREYFAEAKKDVINFSKRWKSYNDTYVGGKLEHILLDHQAFLFRDYPSSTTFVNGIPDGNVRRASDVKKLRFLMKLEDGDGKGNAGHINRIDVLSHGTNNQSALSLRKFGNDFQDCFHAIISSYIMKAMRYYAEKDQDDPEDALENVLHNSNIHGDLKNVIQDAVFHFRMSSAAKMKSPGDRVSLYDRGFSLTTISQNGDTAELKTAEVGIFPESILVSLAETNKVILVSATALSKSLLNFDYDYLPSMLGDHFHWYDQEKYSRRISGFMRYEEMEGQMEIITDNSFHGKHQKGTHDLIPEIEQIPEINSQITGWTEPIAYIAQLITGETWSKDGGNDKLYDCFRYLCNNVFQDMTVGQEEGLEGGQRSDSVAYDIRRYAFFTQQYLNLQKNDIQSALAFCTATLKNSNPYFRKDVMESLFQLVCDCHGFAPFRLHVLDSDGIKRGDREKIKDDYAAGKKVIVFTSRNSMGIGSNFTLPTSEKDNDVISFVPKAVGRKEDEGVINFQAVIVGDITNVLARVGRPKRDSNTGVLYDMLKRAMEAAEAEQRGDMDGYEKGKYIRQRFGYHPLDKRMCYLSEVAKWTVQCIGRIFRSTNYHRKIYVGITAENHQALLDESMDRYLCTPPVRRFLDDIPAERIENSEKLSSREGQVACRRLATGAGRLARQINLVKRTGVFGEKKRKNDEEIKASLKARKNGDMPEDYWKQADKYTEWNTVDKTGLVITEERYQSLSQNMKNLYAPVTREIAEKGYWYIQKGDGFSDIICRENKKEVEATEIFEKDTLAVPVSIDACGASQMNHFVPWKGWCREHGIWSGELPDGDRLYMLNPAAYNNLWKGRFGETAWDAAAEILKIDSIQIGPEDTLRHESADRFSSDGRAAYDVKFYARESERQKSPEEIREDLRGEKGARCGAELYFYINTRPTPQKHHTEHYSVKNNFTGKETQIFEIPLFYENREEKEVMFNEQAVQVLMKHAPHKTEEVD